MKHNRILALTVALGLAAGAMAQSAYSFAFRTEGCTDSMLYIARHQRDQLELVDSTRQRSGNYTFAGKRNWSRGVYALVRQDKKTVLTDFCIDRSRNFSISGDQKMSPASIAVKGCESNSQMFAFLATEAEAKSQIDDINRRKKDASTREKAEADEKALIVRMHDYEATARHPKQENIFFALYNLCDAGDVPDSIEDKAVYYRRHYWDALFEGIGKADRTALMSSPQLYSKLNYFFFGLLYYADSDTICAEIDRLAARIGTDTELLRYVFDHIEPRYFRSTKNVGWDAVWCHLARNYYMAGRCPWATEGTLYNMRYNLDRISQSLIGVKGQELLMADTNQSENPKDWISSHRLPNDYVVLWFWDPDCHHCQEQSAALKVLYDSLRAAGNRRFEIYAIGFESDVDKWKRYVREHDFRWINVGGTNVNIDYQEAYNVHGAPTMVILNKRREIIMNKVIPAKNLMQFLDQYEEQESKKSGHN